MVSHLKRQQVGSRIGLGSVVDLKIWGYQSDLLRAGFKIAGSRQFGLGLTDT